MAKLIEIDLNPSERVLRQFGFIALFGFGALAAMAHTEAMLFAFGLGAARGPVTLALLGLGVLSALLAVVAPRHNRYVYVGLSLLTYPIGFALSHLILAALFFGLFTPLALLLRITRRDPLARHRDPSAPTYWQTPRPHRPRKDYFRQF